MEWYNFRKRKLIIIEPALNYYIPYTKDTIGTDFLIVTVLENEWYKTVIAKEHLQKAADFFFDKIKKDEMFIEKRIKQSREIAKKWLEFCRGRLTMALEKKSNDELLRLLEEYYKFHSDYSVSNIAPWIFLPDKLHEYVLTKIDGGLFPLLSTPNSLTYIKEEELAVLSEAIRIKEKKIKKWEKAAEKLSARYFWIPFDYLGPTIWNKEHYVKRISDLLSIDIKILKKQEKEIIDYQADVEKKQKAVTKKLPAKTVNLLEAVKGLTVLQDEKKAVTTETHFYLQLFFIELAKRTGMKYDDFYFLLNDEVRSALKGKNLSNLAQQRKEFSISIVEKGKGRVLHGENARDYVKKNQIILPSEENEKKITELKGVTGSKGHVSGIIQVIDSAANISKFKKGRILVTPMTTPAFVQIMRSAIAIVTDEGGITCHAAIIARELGIPCVINTGKATSVFKDGDKVEVDADKGIVRKIK